MTTVEKLLVQIFERKNSIIEQLKQQTESYSYHLASKCLINGISPPSWLWNPSTSNSEELNKEELISKLLRQHSQPSARWSYTQYPGYSNLVNTGENEEFCDRVSGENSSCSKGLNIHNDPAVPTLHSVDHGECTLNFAPKLHASVNSPEDQTDERISNIYNAPDQFLAGIKRSKSRQKALVLRSSAKATAKSGARRLSISDVITSQIRFSLSATDQAGQNDELPQSAEPCDAGGQSCEEINLDEAVGTSRNMGGKALELHNSAKTLAKSGLRRESISDVVSSQTRFSISDTDRAGLNDELPQVAEPCAIGIQIEEMNFDEADSTGREIGMDTYSDIETSSRICTEVPVSAKGYFTSGCSSEYLKKNTISHFAKARRTESIPLSHSEHADNYVKSPKSGGPSTTAKITMSTISRERKSCGSDSSKADSSSGNNQGVDIDIMDSRNVLPPEFIDGSLVEVSLCNVPNGGCGARESISEDFNRHKARNTFPSGSCIQQNARAVEVSNLEVSSLSAKVDGVVLASSSSVSERQVTDSHEVSRLGQPTATLSRRLTRSQTRVNDKESHNLVAYSENPSFSGKISKSDCEQKSAEDLQNRLSGKSALACYGTHNTIHDDKNGSFVMERELVLHDHIDQSCSSSHYTKERSGLQSQVAPALPVTFALVEPKLFDCKETDEYNLKAFTSPSGKRKLDDLSEKMRCSMSVPKTDVSLGKGLCGSANLLSLGKHSAEMSDASREGIKNHRDTFEADVQENPGTAAEIFEHVISDTMLKATEDYTEVGLNCKLSEAHHETDNMLSKISDILNIQSHPAKLHVEHRLESSPLRDLKEGDWTSEEKDKGRLVSSALESSRPSHYHSSDEEPRAESYDRLIKEIETVNPIALYETEQFAAQQSQISSCLGGEVQTHLGVSSLGDNVLGTQGKVRFQAENSSIERRATHTCMESWPLIKRRKIEHEKAHSFATSCSFLENMSDSIQKSPVTTCLKTVERNVDTVFVEHLNKSSDTGFSTEWNSNLMAGIKSSLLSIHGEVGSCYNKKNEHKDSCSDINNELLQATLFSSSTMKASRNSQGCNLEKISTSLSNSNLFDTKRKENLANEDTASKKASKGANISGVQKKQQTKQKQLGVKISTDKALNEGVSKNDSGTVSDSKARNLDSEKLVDVSTKKGGRVKSKSEKDTSKYSVTEDNEKDREASLVSTEKSAKDDVSQEETPRTGTKRKRTPGSDNNPQISHYGKNLVGSKVKIWWPDDALFYECVVTSFNPVNMKHKVVYDDGDVEVITLRNERWEFVGDDSVLDGDQSAEHPSQDASSNKKKKKGPVSAQTSNKREKKDDPPKRKTKGSATKSGSNESKAEPESTENSEDESDKSDHSEESEGESPDRSTKVSGKASVKSRDIVAAKTSGKKKQDAQCSKGKTPQSKGKTPQSKGKAPQSGKTVTPVGKVTKKSSLLKAIMNGDEQCSKLSYTLEKNATCPGSENMKNSSTLLEGMQSLKWEGDLHPPQSVFPLNNEDLQPTDVDQSMPVFEGFTVDTPTESGELNFAAGVFDCDRLKLPRSTFERASILAEICRSASSDGLSCQFSSALETQNLFQSLPNGSHFEHLDFEDTFPLNSDIGEHLQSGSSSSGDYKDVIDGMPYSVSLAYTGERYGWSSRNQHPSPVGKLWDRLSSHTGSSGKRSSNPELTCFPIEEDPSDSEENKTMDENSSDIHGDIDSSLGNHSDKRQPLKDLTNLKLNKSASVEEETSNHVCEDFASTKLSVTGTHEKVRRGPEYRTRNKSENSQKQTFSIGSTNTRTNQPLSIGANRMKKAKESINKSICKPIVSNKTSLQAQKQKLSLKESTRNNIVSNVSSFIPLIQQKQAATACAGKGNVKVKALEAAENAKRLGEKKEFERKQKKEAMKVERAKLVEKKLRHMEQEKKRKEEEHKKKDAEIVAKKRLREEEERMEKEKKRMRLEVRQRQREQEEKKRVEKAEKENQRSKDEQMNSKKELQNEPKKQLHRETTKEDEVAFQKAETKLALTGVVMNYEECGTSGLSCEAEKAMHTTDKSPRKEDLIAMNSQGKSYEISPYQCSDDEDDEDDELPTKKYFPSWASKSSVALYLPLQQEIDPDVIFPPESFCSMDEVLLPRKLQKSQVAA